MFKLAVALAGVLVALAAGVALGASSDPTFSWFQGDPYSHVAGIDRPGPNGQPSGDLDLQAANDMNVVARHVRFGTYDGNYEFEHSDAVPYTLLNSYYLGGTGVRTPIVVGGTDGQDVLSFIVTGMLGQKHDLQQWRPSGKVVAAIDGRGRLRLGQVTLTAQIRKGHATLVAILPDGTQQVLAVGRSS